ncbi:WG repeat-containing protein [Blautia sp.]|uniref:WG repeat-containing protein n=1 Tax=Blautia sp. TaxID=1955243 RepID=UPI003AF72F94
MKKCPNCGKENIDEAKFCTWCRYGFPVTVENKTNNKGKKIALGILVIAICACLGGVYMLLENGKNENSQKQKIAQNSESVQQDKSSQEDESAETDEAAESISGEYLAPFMNSDSKWGYINQDGEVVIECKYDSASGFDKDGYAVVGMETDSDASEYYTIYGLINSKGEEIISPDYSYINDSIANTCDNYGYRTISRLPYPFYYEEEYWGVIDNNGNIMISPEYSRISNIGDPGYYIASDAETGMYGIIDEDYEWVCEPEYSWIINTWEKSTENVAKVDGEYALIAKYDFQEGHGAKIINEYGDTIVPMDYYDIEWVVGNNRIIVENDEGYYGAIDMHGEVQIPCQYDEIGSFSYGDETYAIREGEVFLVDIYGNERFLTNADSCYQLDSNLYEISSDEKSNIINSSGEYLLPENYEGIMINESCIAGNTEGEGKGILLSRSGEVLSREYDQYMLFSMIPEITVYNEENCGVIDSYGNVIVPCEYDACYVCKDSPYITANKQEEEYGDYTECTLFDINGNVIKEFDAGIYNVGAFQKVSDAA